MGTGSVVVYDWPAFKSPLCANVPRSIGEERLGEAEAKTSSFQVVAIVSPLPWLATVHDRVAMVPAWSCAGAVNEDTTRSAGSDVTETVPVLAAILLERSIS